jgi:hypothetical protein
MGFWSKVGNAISSVGRAVTSAVSSAWEGAKSMASKAVGWMAEKAEGFIGKVADVWNKIKPLIRPALKAFGKWAPWPWLKGVAIGLEKALDWIEKAESSPFGKKIKSAIDWVIQAARNIKDRFLSGKDLDEAQEREDIFNEAAANMPSEERKAVELAGLINKFILVQSLIQRTFDEGAVNDFEHYLRLRATQKLLAWSEKTLTESQNIEDIGDDEVFLISIGADLMAPTADVSDVDLNRLNSLVYSHFKKELIPFVFEEMVVAWAKNLVDLDRKWELGNKALAKDTVKLRTLENMQKLGSELDTSEQNLLSLLSKSVPALKMEQDVLAKANREMRNYVFAAEGFLEILEGNAALEGKEYLVEQCNTVGKIIIDCAQHGKKWEALREDEKELIIDFANIFKQASLKRAEALQEVEVAV